MILYHRDDCPFCWKCRIAFAYAGTALDYVDVERGTAHPEVAKLSATATIPVLVNNKTVITQSGVLLEYINEAFCNGTLLPSGASQRAKVRELCAYSDNVIGKSLRGLVFERRDKVTADQNPDIISQSDKQWRECLDYLDAKIVGPFFLEEFSMADCALLPRFALAARYDSAVDGRHPNALRYWKEASQTKCFLSSSSDHN